MITITITTTTTRHAFCMGGRSTYSKCLNRSGGAHAKHIKANKITNHNMGPPRTIKALRVGTTTATQQTAMMPSSTAGLGSNTSWSFVNRAVGVVVALVGVDFKLQWMKQCKWQW